MWSALKNVVDVPFKSALSKVRGRVSFTLFRDEYDSLIDGYESDRKTWRGLKVFGTDGDQYSLPASEDVVNAGYKGYPCKDGMETHYPRMYVVHCCDLISGVSRQFRYSPENQEMQLALEIATMLEPRSVTLYDRLFFSRPLVLAHAASMSYFFARCKSGETVLSEIQEFEASAAKKKKVVIEGQEVTLLKIKNPKTDETCVFATNLPRKYLKQKRAEELYAIRWGIESNHRDLTETMKIEKWHSRSINGIQQEIYAMLWATNMARIQIAKAIKKKESISPENRIYISVNFKAVLDFLAKWLIQFAKTKSRKIITDLRLLIERSKERRERLSREAPKVIKYENKRFPSASLVKRRK